jgi:hypothetical protein
MSAEYIKAYRCDGNFQPINSSAPDVSIGCAPLHITSNALPIIRNAAQRNDLWCHLSHLMRIETNSRNAFGFTGVVSR